MFKANDFYKKDIHLIASGNIDWNKLKNKKILVTGATGLIGTFLVDLLMYRNINYNDGIIIYAMGRNKEKAFTRFNEYFDSDCFFFIEHDIQKEINLNAPIDYIIHGASNTHPIAYATEPINTILLSVLGTKSVLDFASIQNVERTLFLSTVEIYGENRGDVESFNEDYCGYINCNTLRAGYPEGKRTAEALCQAYIKEKNIDIVIARCCRIYGPTMGDDDSKVIAQFIKNAVMGENITLKSKGDQQYSYCYVADACSALLTLLLNGKKGEAYNVCEPDCNLSLLQIADIFSDYTGKKIVFDIPSSLESSGYSKATKALLDNSKIYRLGWEALYPIKDGIIRTIDILHYNQ
ncbi:MAG: NAD-dependent epimerase/dehydratase family protein [Treponema sp.]|jgi:nucleoside-diphosphate-sugar epimerase|nr:NAD-dependent epimerase/dehydratase family protein [Treponema sp.]